MSQHFLLSPASRNLSARKVARFSEKKARKVFARIRWSNNGGRPTCPRCGCEAYYKIRTRKTFKCKRCYHQFTPTSGTIFHGHKLSYATILYAIAVFLNDVKGRSALSMLKDVGVSYKTMFVLQHKVRECISDQISRIYFAAYEDVEVDGNYQGGYVKPTNWVENRRDRRKAENQSGKRQCIVAMRGRNGGILPYVVPSEAAAVGLIKKHVDRKAVMHADEGTG